MVGNLTLSRKIGQTIKIGQGIEITVRKIEGQRVSLVIKADKGVSILRGELERRVA